MKYLVTGGAGFIGSHLVDYLLKTGHEVVCVDNFDKFYSDEIKMDNLKNAASNKNFTLLKIDIRDSAALEPVFKSYDFDVIFHLAAKAGVRPSIENPKEYYDVNVLGTLNILEMIRKYNKSKKLVFTSSSSVYGNNNKIPFNENDTVDHPISPYAASKKSAELICYNYHYLYNIKVNCLRLFTVYGPRQRPDLAIHKFTDLIIQNKEITIYGNGSMKRDYTFVTDILEGIIKAAENLNGFEIINLGNSYPVSLLELVQDLSEILNISPVIKYEAQPPGDVKLTFADISKAKRLLNYKPSCSFKNGLMEFIKWKKA